MLLSVTLVMLKGFSNKCLAMELTLHLTEVASYALLSDTKDIFLGLIVQNFVGNQQIIVTVKIIASELVMSSL
jgi:hypothetical protein